MLAVSSAMDVALAMSIAPCAVSSALLPFHSDTLTQMRCTQCASTQEGAILSGSQGAESGRVSAAPRALAAGKREQSPLQGPREDRPAGPDQRLSKPQGRGSNQAEADALESVLVQCESGVPDSPAR